MAAPIRADGLPEALGLQAVPPFCVGVVGGRWRVIEHTAKQTTKEVIRDLGNVVCAVFCADGVLSASYNRELFTPDNFHEDVLRNVKVLRVLADARAYPDIVVPWVKDAARREANKYRDFSIGGPLRDEFLEDKRRQGIDPSRDNPGPSMLDRPYFREHGECETYRAEKHRLLQSVTSLLFILANLKALEVKPLADYASMGLQVDESLLSYPNLARRQMHVGTFDRFKVVLIDWFFLQPEQANTPAAKRHREIIRVGSPGNWRIYSLFEQTRVAIRVTEWNAPFYNEEGTFPFMVRTSTYGPRGIPSLAVLPIPLDYKGPPDDTVDAVLQNFFDYATPELRAQAKRAP